MSSRWCPVCLDPLDRRDESVPCRRCGNRLRFDDALTALPTEALIAVDERPWLTVRDTPRGFVLRASLRSWFALLPGAWVAISAASLLVHVGVALRGHVPVAGLAVSLAMLAGFGLLLALALVGEQTLAVDGDEATLTTRAGPLSWSERLSWSGVRAVRVERYARAGGVFLDGDGEKYFGQMLSPRRQLEVARALFPRLGS